jgi:Xaa-Pro aminopeptidase
MSRADRLVELLEERELDSLLVSNLVNVRYLTGFTGTNGACVVTRSERLFLTDSRYTEQARQQVGGFELLQASQALLGELAPRPRGGTTGNKGASRGAGHASGDGDRRPGLR